MLIVSGCATAGRQAGHVSELTVAAGLKRERPLLCKDLKEMDCKNRLRDVFTARLSEVYWAADGQGLTNKCNAHPLECNPELLEQWAMDSHNANVSARAQHEQNVRLENTSAAMKRANEALAPKGQRCRTLPNGLGGFDTVCK